jgi:hypothetical protein
LHAERRNPEKWPKDFSADSNDSRCEYYVQEMMEVANKYKQLKGKPEELAEYIEERRGYTKGIMESAYLLWKWEADAYKGKVEVEQVAKDSRRKE